MILKLNTYNHCFFGDSAFKYYVVENNDTTYVIRK